MRLCLCIRIVQINTVSHSQTLKVDIVFHQGWDDFSRDKAVSPICAQPYRLRQLTFSNHPINRVKATPDQLGQ